MEQGLKSSRHCEENRRRRYVCGQNNKIIEYDNCKDSLKISQTIITSSLDIKIYILQRKIHPAPVGNQTLHSGSS